MVNRSEGYLSSKIYKKYKRLDDVKSLWCISGFWLGSCWLEEVRSLSLKVFRQRLMGHLLELLWRRMLHYKRTELNYSEFLPVERFFNSLILFTLLPWSSVSSDLSLSLECHTVPFLLRNKAQGKMRIAQCSSPVKSGKRWIAWTVICRALVRFLRITDQSLNRVWKQLAYVIEVFFYQVSHLLSSLSFSSIRLF